MDLSQHEEADSLEKADNVSETTPISNLEANPGVTSLPDQPGSSASPAASPGDKPEKEVKTAKKDNPDKVGLLKKVFLIFRHFDIYFLAFIFVILVAGVVLVLAIDHDKAPSNTSAQTQTLNQSTVSQLNNSDTSVGGSGQTLEIQSSTIFSNNVLVKGNFDVAGALKLSGALTLPGLNVSGITDLDQLQVGGNATVQGTLTAQAGLGVAGPASFNGSVTAQSLTVSNLQLNGDITINHHIYTAGGIPHLSGTNAGGGGTASINGTDTAGTINIGLGSGVSSGCITHVNFATNFNSTPHVVATPVGSDPNSMASLGTFYISNLSTSGFSVCVSNPPSSGLTFNVDYITFD